MADIARERILNERYKNEWSKVGPNHPIMKLLKKVRQRHRVNTKGKMPLKGILLKRKITMNLTEILKREADVEQGEEEDSTFDMKNAKFQSPTTTDSRRSQEKKKFVEFLQEMRAEIRQDMENLTNQVRLVDGHIDAVIEQMP